VQQAQARQDRADATVEANITAANSNDAIAAQIEELRRDLAPKETGETVMPPLRFHPEPEPDVMEEAAE
jgi:hypothetical protein